MWMYGHLALRLPAGIGLRPGAPVGGAAVSVRIVPAAPGQFSAAVVHPVGAGRTALWTAVVELRRPVRDDDAAHEGQAEKGKGTDDHADVRRHNNLYFLVTCYIRHVYRRIFL